ncbi:uncharacterized protein MKK02DRAFT_45862 [Dioszegia hungarica]|uniref:MPN domain-containing protein n=1 Tax=Dioszegia hungarica TaxID=4972 RepID=A0AA38HAE8_9TREE|nr:uncharacterized protein MKK02DRAFT_45862 [Dioszegia hungarica]KAI9637150.1 hypothetical protein MKK02DRAFT_45862 [Dioszegia hungarica]
MASMAATLAASLPAPVVAQKPKEQSSSQSAKVPQRMEGVLDVEAAREVESVNLNSLALLKIMKHSTDILPPPPSTTYQQDRNAPPATKLSSHPDAVGVILGLDLEGVLEVEDCFALPGGETNLGPNSYSTHLLSHLSDVSTPSSPIGLYLSTHNGGFLTRSTIDLLNAVEKLMGRGKAVLLVHDASSSRGDGGVRAYRLTEGGRAAGKDGKWDGTSLTEHRLTSSNLLQSLPITTSSPPLLAAFLSTLVSPSTPSSSLKSPSTPLPAAFQSLSNPLPTTLPAYLSDTLDALTLYNHEANNVAFLSRQIAREKTRHEGAIREREEENLRRKKQGLVELPSLPAEARGGTKEPSRLELMCLQGQVEGLAHGMGSEAGAGLVRCYL